MKTYILVRAFYSVITLWLLVTIIFAMVRITGTHEDEGRGGC